MPRRIHAAVANTTEPGSLARVDMRAAKKTTENRKVLQELVPLNALSSERFDSLVEKIVIEEVKSGRYLFRKGDRDNQTIYLLAGKISLMDGFRKVSGEIEAGTEASRHPIAAQQPRPYSARVVKKAVIARIDSSLLDAFLSWDQSSTAEVGDIGADDDGDWMTRLLQSEAFRKLPPSKLQGLLMKMQPLQVSKGEVVIEEGGEGDYFYTIHEGRCAVTRQDGAGGKPQPLAELGDGDSFGEDALVSNCGRNATVTMLTDGMLMRLAKQDFVDLLKTQLVRHVGFEQAQQMARDGAVWLDVRTRDEYQHGCIADSVNIPLISLRDELSELVTDAKYIICCDTGSRSESAAFLLSHKGLDVCVLEKGLPDLSLPGPAPGVTAGQVGAEQVAEVVELAATFIDSARPLPAETPADDQVARLQADYDALRSRHEALLAEQEQRRAAELRLEEQLEQLRGELGGSAGKLDALNTQVDAHADEKQTLLDQYAGLQELHAEQLQSLQLELEQERSKARELATRVEATAGECDSLKQQVAAAKQDAQAELTRLQAELAQAHGRLGELEAAVELANASRMVLQEESQASTEHSHSALQALQDQLNAARGDVERLSTELATVTGERQDLSREVATLRVEIAALQEATSETSGKLVEEGEVVTELRAQNAEQNRQIVQLQGELAERQAQLDSRAADHENRIHDLQQQLEHQLADSEQSYSELQSLQDELDAARSDAERLSAELVAVTEQRQELARKIASLGGEMAALQEAAATTSGKLAKKGDVAASLRAQNDELVRQTGQLQAELAARESRLEQTATENEARIQELQQQLEQLQAELAVSETQLKNSAAENEARTKELQQQLEQLNAELAARETQLENSAVENEARTQELQAQLEQLQAELAARESLLENAATENEASTHELQQQLEQLQAELAARQSQLESSVAGHERQAQELQQQIDQHQAGLQQAQEQLQAVTAEHQQAQTTIDALREENRQLEAAGSDANRTYQAQLKRAEGLLAERNTATAVYAKQQIEWDQQRSALQEQAAKEQQAASKLGKELEQLTSAMAEASADFEQKLQQQVEEANAVLEQQVQRFAELEQSALETADELELLKQEYDEIKRQAEQSASEKADLGKKIADKDAQIEASRVELGQYEVDKTVLGQELELSRQQVQELQQALVQFEARVKSLEQDLQESTRKAHDDLKRKNENEKELQAQIEQQRKKLEQLTADFQKSRGEAQDTIDYLRDELHAERDARDMERVEMATRQRELKERLAAAGANKDNAGDHSDVIEEAVDAVRAEEHSRLQGVLDAHAETEQRLVRVQAELQQAHAELAEHHREEKSRRQGDIELMAEQNRQAEAAIAQLQDQLQQLTLERDGAFEQQQELREKIDSLRAEVEVTRESMKGAAHGQQEDPVQLRKQLEDTRRNVEISVRLRTEAEAARDRLLEERDKLLEQLEKSEHVSAPARDAEPPASGSWWARKKTASASPAAGQVAKQKTSQPEAPPKQAADSAGRLPHWLGAAIGVLAVSVIVVFGWLLMTAEPQVEDMASVAMQEADAGAEAENMPPAPVEPSKAEAVQEPQAELAQPAPIVREKPTSVAEQAKPVKQKEVTKAAVQEKQEEPSKQETPVVKTNPVLQTFSDRLKIGGRGPAMIKLAAVSYQMGSVGNSINSTEVPRHEVTLPVFSISRLEVTFDEYEKYTRATGKRLPRDEGWGQGKQPVINVSWSDAEGYVKWLSGQTGKTYRLPTEAEWEYAARGGNDDNYWWVGVHKNIPANCFDCGSDWDGARTAPVGQFAANAYGLHDMAGNVQEWTADCYNENYSGAPADGSAWLTPECSARVVRGGAYSSPQDSLRSAKRVRMDQDTRLDNLGFRVVRVE